MKLETKVGFVGGTTSDRHDFQYWQSFAVQVLLQDSVD